jgi:hypothetical protein
MTPMYGPAVRRKRFSSIRRRAVLHQCIRPLIGARCAPGHHGYQRAYVLITGQASSGAIWVTRVRVRREDRSSISFHPLADLGRETGTMSSLSPDQCSSFVRAMRLFLRPGLREFQGIARRGRQGWPSRLALHHIGVSRPRLDGREHGCHAHADRGAITFVLAHSKLRPLLRTAHAMRASLLASAIASTL